MRTNDLKKLVKEKLDTLKYKTYFEYAADDGIYPHIVFNFREIDLGDLARQDYILEIDVWTKGTDSTTIDNIADSVEDLLQAENLPQEHILPTFYKRDRKAIEDPDKKIKHRMIRFQVQNYTR